MKQKIIIILMFGFFLCSSQTFAASERSLESTLAKPYLSFETGYAFSLQGNLDVSESRNSLSGFVWDHANEGWNSKLGNSSMKFGYRFLYAGNFKTQDYITDDPDGQHQGVPGSGNAANPWSGTLKANEIYAGLSYTW